MSNKETSFKKLLLVFILFLTVGCATIPKYDLNNNAAVKKLYDLDGEYDNYPHSDTIREYQTINRIINWKANKTDTSKVYKIGISAGEKTLKFTSFKTDGKQEIRNIKGKLTGNGFVKLNNRNFRLTGIPYVLGYFDYKKIEIGLTKENDLIINGVEKSEGALLFVLGYGPPKHEFQFIYKRK